MRKTSKQTRVIHCEGSLLHPRSELQPRVHMGPSSRCLMDTYHPNTKCNPPSAPSVVPLTRIIKIRTRSPLGPTVCSTVAPFHRAGKTGVRNCSNAPLNLRMKRKKPPIALGWVPSPSPFSSLLCFALLPLFGIRTFQWLPLSMASFPSVIRTLIFMPPERWPPSPSHWAPSPVDWIRPIPRSRGGGWELVSCSWIGGRRRLFLLRLLTMNR